MGKKTLAYTFAKTLQCDEHGVNPCGHCKSCLQLESQSHPDIISVQHEKVNIGVDDIRLQLNSDIAIKPYSSKYKIYIIDDADRMTEQAQNALLKTIEEPPEYAIILLLTCNSSKLLDTILSRCVLLNLKPVATTAIKDYLIDHCNCTEYTASVSANFSQGVLGRAIRYASSEEFSNIKEDILHLLKHIDEMELYEIVEAIRNLSTHKLEIKDYIDLMILWYRDILMFKVTKNLNLLLFKEEYKYISKQASKKDYEGVENIINAMNKAKVRLDANVNFDTTMELMLLTLKEN